MSKSDKININERKKYLETHNVTKYIEELMSALMKDKPDEPLMFMMNFIQEKAKQKGINIPLQTKFETSDAFSVVNDLNSRSYDKPWLNRTIKKDKNNLQQNVVREDSNVNKTMKPSSCIESSLLDEEFNLVSPDNSNATNSTQTINNGLPNVKKLNRGSETKEIVLKLVNEEENNKLAEKQKLKERNNEKQTLNEEYDSACELAEDPEIRQNELNVSNSSSKPMTGIVIKKQILENTTVRMTICHNCAKICQIGDDNSSKDQWSSIFAENSVILDDIESASQVNGPRPISGKDNRIFQSTNSKKIISVKDIEATAKGWSVLDSGSESSMNKRDLVRARPSSRHFEK